MAYADFTLDSVEQALGVSIKLGELFPQIDPLPVSEWLEESLALGRASAALLTEKARSEFVVVPILLAARETCSNILTIFFRPEVGCRTVAWAGRRMRLHPGEDRACPQAQGTARHDS